MNKGEFNALTGTCVRGSEEFEGTSDDAVCPEILSYN
jgi:hypothetical protein